MRVPLHGRRIRGWIAEIDVEPEGRELLTVLGVVSAGPPADVIALSDWVAWRWCGPRVAVLRSASPPNNVTLNLVCAEAAPTGPSTTSTADAVVRWPPLLDRRAARTNE